MPPQSPHHVPLHSLSLWKVKEGQTHKSRKVKEGQTHKNRKVKEGQTHKSLEI
jgi:hypothetical protein